MVISLLLQAKKREDAELQYEKLKNVFPNSFYTRKLQPLFDRND